MSLSRSTFVLAVLLTVFAASAFAGPVLTIEPENFVFGYAPQNSKVSHTFKLTNTGDETLKIDRVVPGCGCTKAPLKKDVLVAGESTELEIIFSTRRYNGKVMKHPSITSNGSANPLKVTIQTDVITRPDSAYPVIISPYKLDISQFGERLRDEMNFTLENRSDKDLKPTLIDYPADLMTVTLPELIPAGGSVKGKVELAESALPQEFEKSITLQFDDQGNSRYSIPVKRAVSTPKASANASAPVSGRSH